MYCSISVYIKYRYFSGFHTLLRTHNSVPVCIYHGQQLHVAVCLPCRLSFPRPLANTIHMCKYVNSTLVDHYQIKPLPHNILLTHALCINNDISVYDHFHAYLLMSDQLGW